MKTNNNKTMKETDLCKKKFLILQDISSAIVAMDHINAIANLILDLAINYTNAEKGSLMLTNDRGELYILAAKGIDMRLIRTYKVKIGEGVAGTVAKNRLPVIVSDIDEDRRFKGKKRDRYKTRSFVSCPILSSKRLLGVLNINDKKDKTPFTEDEFVLIKIIADQAAISLENAFLKNQLKAKAAELEEINRKLIKTDVARTEFLTRVTHELRTPLNSIKGAIYYLQKSEKLDRQEQGEFYDIISNETSDLISIIENLFDFIRLEDEMKVVNKSVINIADLLRETLNSKLLRNSLTKKNLKMNIDIQDAISGIVGDKIKIVQFFINLIEGLSHYLDKGDTIGISINENDFVEVQLELSKRMPEPIFTYLLKARKVFDIDQPEEIVKLYLARKVVEIHYWNLDIKNKNGSCFISIKIPKSIRQKTDAGISVTMEMFAEFVSDVLDIDICSIMLSDEFTGELTIKGSRGLSEDTKKHTRLRLGDKIAGWVALEGKPLLIEDIETDTRFIKKNVPQYNTKSLISLPLKLQDRVVGVLNLNNKKNTEPLTMQDFQIASVIGERISYFIEKFMSGEYSESDFRRFTTSFDNLLNVEKRYHKKQSILPDLMNKIMDALGTSEEDKKIAQYVSIVYDLGLMLIDESILKKKKLSTSEARGLKLHPYNTISLLDTLEFSEVVKRAILHHHESYDGTGYPDGLKGEDIPFISRVLSVIDSFCAMTVERHYKKRFTAEEALQEIKKGSGSIYDPEVVKTLEKVLLKYKYVEPGLKPELRMV